MTAGRIPDPGRAPRWARRVAALVLVVGAPSCATRGTGEITAPADERDGRRTTTTAPPGPAEIPSSWTWASAPDGSFVVGLPTTWALTTDEGEPAEIAERLVPGQWSAGFVADVVSVRRDVEHGQAIAIDTWGWTDSPPALMLTVSRLPDGTDAAAAAATYRTEPPAAGMTVLEETRLEGTTGEIIRLSSTVSSYFEEAVVYFVPDGDHAWRLILWIEVNDNTAPGDRIAASFTPGSAPA